MKTKEKAERIIERLIKIPIELYNKVYEDRLTILRCISNNIKIKFILCDQRIPSIEINGVRFNYAFHEKKILIRDEALVYLITKYCYEIKSYIDQKNTSRNNNNIQESIDKVYEIMH